MSRIGKKPISIPDKVTVTVDQNEVLVKGPKGELRFKARPEVKVEMSQNSISVSPTKESNLSRSLWGLTRTLIENMIDGTVKGHEKKLEIQGVGYRASLEGKDLVLMVGFSHPVKIKCPEGITFSLEKNVLTVSGPDKALVGQTAANIRKIKKPEPYKGKGIRYVGEHVRKKVGKKAVGTE